MNDIIILAVQLGVMIAAFVVGKYVFPNIPKDVADKLKVLSAWAGQFVVWAREFMQSATGEEKMEKVVEMLKEIADEAGIKVTEDQLRAIVQAAYESMKAGESDADALAAEYHKIGDREYAKGSTVIINAQGTAQIGNDAAEDTKELK